MRFGPLAAASALAIAALAATVQSAASQSVVQSIFGLGQATPSAQPMPGAIPAYRIPAYRISARRLRRASRIASQSKPEAEAGIGPPDSGGPYRTMCVRTCDGYYFPIRTYALNKNFAADAKTCQSSCGSEAELYFHPTFAGAPATMLDLKGRKYAELPTAFAFRTAMKPGCACKPPAWSEAAKAQHREYARIEDEELAKDRAFLAARAAAAATADTAQQPPRAADAQDTPGSPANETDIVAGVDPDSHPSTLRPRTRFRITRSNTPDFTAGPRRLSRPVRYVQRYYVKPAQGGAFLSW